LARRAGGLPPHLLPGITSRRRKDNRRTAGIMVAAGALLGVFLIILLVGFVTSTAAAIGGTVHAYKEVNKDLPNAAQVAVDTFETTTITDRNGVKLQSVDQVEGGWRTFKPLDQMSQYVIDATVAAEDATFWTHYGVEPIAIIRGAVINLNGSGSSGGSTITQQLARGLYPEQVGTDISVTRKVKEALVAVAIDDEFSKEDILTMYLNSIFYGQRSFGIEAAANTYFNKHADELTLGEASLLAGLPQAPSFFDPTVRFDQAKKRQKYVLDQMVKYDYITPQQAKDAFNENLDPQTRNGSVEHAPHFTQYVRSYIEEHWPGALYNGGLTITTSIDVELQEEAERIVANGVAEAAGYERNNAAMVIMVPWSGQILAMVGSASFDDPFIGGQVNYAIEKRQPGSSMKPIVYAAAFESGWNPGTVVMDDPIKEPTGNPDNPYYEPKNYSGSFNGAVSVRQALANSYNIPAVKAIKYAGIEHVMDLAKRMGMEKSLDRPYYDYGLSLSLGSGEVQLLEHTNVYATFANLGTYVPANPILKIVDSQGNVLYDVERDKPWENATQALKAEYAYQIMTILTDNESRSLVFGENNLFGNTQSELGRPTAAKSGTTDSWRDIWTMGYTTDVAIGVWMGNTSFDGSSPLELPELDGIAGAGPIWQDAMLMMHNDSRWSDYLDGSNGRPLNEDFARPAGIYQGEICDATGGKPVAGFETHEEWLVKGEGPSLRCDQISAYDAKELEDAVDDLQNSGPWTGSAWDRIMRYRDAVSGFNTGYESYDDSPPIESIDDNSFEESDNSIDDSGEFEEDSGSGWNTDDESGNSDNSDGGNSPPIESRDD
jgi:membrane peptidoglycan carboxypeptidase